MTARPFVPFLSLFFLVGCGDASPAPPAPASATSAPVTVPFIGEVQAVRVSDFRQGGPRVAATRDATKMRRVVDLLGLVDAPRETTEAPKCAKTAEVEFFDGAGNVAGRVEVGCGTAAPEARQAIVFVGDKRYLAKLSDVEALASLGGDRTLIANWLHGISRVEIDHALGPMEVDHRALETPEDIQKAVATISPLAAFDPEAPQSLCLSDYTVTFIRAVRDGDPVRMRLYITCGHQPLPNQEAWFEAETGLAGGVRANAQAIAALASRRD